MRSSTRDTRAEADPEQAIKLGGRLGVGKRDSEWCCAPAVKPGGIVPATVKRGVDDPD